MRTFLILCLLLSGTCLHAQQHRAPVDTSNYYEYFSDGKNLQGCAPHTSWLKPADIIPVVVEELEKAGYKWVYTNALYILPNKQEIIVPVYCAKSDFGIVIADGHYGMPQKAHRYGKTKWQETQHADFIQSYFEKGKQNTTVVKTLPANILTLHEDSYWYQGTEEAKDDKLLVTKEVIISLLRKDIRRLLQQLPAGAKQVKK